MRGENIFLFLFYSGANIDHRHIKIIYDDDGRPSGEAFIILDAPEKAELAKQNYNRKTIGHRYIEVFGKINHRFL